MEDLIPNKCNYENLLSYKKTKVIFELTYYFCHTYLSKGDRTIDQMIQAARSGKQNIVEGCAASPTSAKTEIRLISVAKASLQELLEVSFHSQPQTMGNGLERDGCNATHWKRAHRCKFFYGNCQDSTA